MIRLNELVPFFLVFVFCSLLFFFINFWSIFINSSFLFGVYSSSFTNYLIDLLLFFFLLLVTLLFINFVNFKWNFEQVLCLFFLLIGLVFCILSYDFLTLYLSLELVGLGMVCLISLDFGDCFWILGDNSSIFIIVSSIKYFLINCFSSIIFLLGVCFLYILCGSIFYIDISLISLLVIIIYFFFNF